MLLRFLMVALVSAGISAAASAQEISRQIRVDESFIKDEMRWRGLPGGYEARVKLIEAHGRLELCGVGVFTNAQLRQTVTHLLRGAKLRINGRVVLEDFYFFNKVSRPRQLDTAMANCKSTGYPVPRGDIDIDVDWPNGTFRN